MIADLEAESIVQLSKEECGGLRSSVTQKNLGAIVEIRARRTPKGSIVLQYSYDGVRLERVVLLALLCTQSGCEQSQTAKRLWAARPPQPPVLQRRPPQNLLASVGKRIKASTLFTEVPIPSVGGNWIARPAVFSVLTPCPANAHNDSQIKMKGWDLFKDGNYIAGGLTHSEANGVITPKFESIKSVAQWIVGSIEFGNVRREPNCA